MNMKEISELRDNFVFFKWFTGEPKTGGEAVAVEIARILSKDFKVSIIEPPWIVEPPDTNATIFDLLRFISRSFMALYLKTIIILDLLKRGNIVYCESPLGSFRYVQPPPLKNQKDRSIEDLFHKIFSTIEYFVRLGKNNLKIVIYNSEYTRSNFNNMVQSSAFECVLYPSIIHVDTPVLFKEKENFSVTISRIVPEKNLDVLEKILYASPYKHYLIGYATSEVYLNKLRGRLERVNAEIIVNADEQEKLKFLRMAKVFINTPINQTADITLMEAMAHGCAPITHNSGAGAELVPPEFLYNSIDEARLLLKRVFENYDEQMFDKIVARSKLFNYELFQSQLLDHFKKAVNFLGYKNILRN